MVSLLLEAGAQDVDQLALRDGVSRRHMLALRLLLGAGASPFTRWRFSACSEKTGDFHITTRVYRASLVTASRKVLLSSEERGSLFVLGSLAVMGVLLVRLMIEILHYRVLKVMQEVYHQQ